MCRKKNFSTGNWRTLWKDFFPQPIHPHSTAPVDTRRVAADNFARWLFANRYCPSSARYRSIVLHQVLSDFQSTAWERSTPKSQRFKRGQRPKHSTRAKAKGQPPDGSTRGFLRGNNSSGSELFPLKPASLLTFLPEQESKALLASTCRRLIG